MTSNPFTPTHPERPYRVNYRRYYESSIPETAVLQSMPTTTLETALAGSLYTAGATAAPIYYIPPETQMEQVPPPPATIFALPHAGTLEALIGPLQDQINGLAGRITGLNGQITGLDGQVEALTEHNKLLLEQQLSFSSRFDLPTLVYAMASLVLDEHQKRKSPRSPPSSSSSNAGAAIPDRLATLVKQNLYKTQHADAVKLISKLATETADNRTAAAHPNIDPKGFLEQIIRFGRLALAGTSTSSSSIQLKETNLHLVRSCQKLLKEVWSDAQWSEAGGENLDKLFE